MRLDQITLKNYRCFEQLTVDLHPRLTVLVAVNGAGKTSILDAIRVLFDTYLGAFPTGVGKGIRVSDVRLARAAQPPHFMTAAFPCELHGRGFLVEGHEALSWSRTINSPKSGTTIKNAKSLALYGKRLQTLAQDPQDQTDWPLLAYYGTGRLWDQKKLTSGKAFSSGFFERAAGYIDCLEPASSYKLFVHWFGDAYRAVTQAKIRFMEANPAATPQQILGLQSDFSPLMEAVSDAVNRVLYPTGWGNIWYSETHQDVTASHPEFGTLAISQLSDGIRNTLALVADIAFRAVQLNPHLGAQAARLAEGLVLIDEVDMHLHPSWQQQILQLLRETFPRLQFIVTTHSPQVLTSVPRENIRILDQDENRLMRVRTPNFSPLAHESGDALAKIMGTHREPPLALQDDIRRYEQLVRVGQEQTEEAHTLRAALDEAGYQFHESDLTTWRFLAARHADRNVSKVD
ncbi:MAG: AAA family ATPase [Giesbergeria sp.]|uniref:AAA family ATPase n=1 Tax=Giesbergeria sp. TaxID=2818473 RepID=UPI0026386A1F|nr:AAA family ATPase [Giesbergeria sp.]MDD2610194.1 AAA family ATPase [Giesbergeria sp.]